MAARGWGGDGPGHRPLRWAGERGGKGSEVEGKPSSPYNQSSDRTQPSGAVRALWGTPFP